MIQHRELSPGIYGFDDVAIGDQIKTSSAVISAELIDKFADVSGDRYALHTDANVARDLGFSDRVAHGLLVLSVIDGLKNNASARLDGLASLSWAWRFERPVLVGDVIHGELTIVEKRLTKSGERAILKIDFKVRNQAGEQVQSGQNELMFNL